MNPEEHDSMLGPGTDLIISLFAISLVLIGLMSGLYFESSEQVLVMEKKIQEGSESLQEGYRLNAMLEKYKAEIKRYKTDIVRLNQSLDKLYKEREEERLTVRRFKKENITAYKEITQLRQTLAALNRNMKAKNIEISELTAELLLLGHNNTPIPKRSPENKEVFRVYAEGNPNYPHFFYKLPGKDQKKIRAARQIIHRKLGFLKSNLGSRLYVSVVIPDEYSMKHTKALRCEFWEYDYYKYFDDYCK